MAIVVRQRRDNGTQGTPRIERPRPDADGWQGASRLGQVVVINRDGKVVDA